MIVNYLVKEQFTSDVGKRSWRNPTTKRRPIYTPVRRSRIELYNEVQKRSHTKIGNSILDSHLDDLVMKHVLRRNAKGGYKNRRLYALDPDILVVYFVYLLQLLTRLIKHERKRYGSYPELLMSRLLQFVIGMG